MRLKLCKSVLRDTLKVINIKMAAIWKSFTCFTLVRALRYLYITIAVLYALYSMFRTFKKIQEGRTVVSISELDLREYLYPSVTMCFKFKDGIKDIIPSLWIDKWKDTGKYHVISYTKCSIQHLRYGNGCFSMNY